MVVPVDQNPRFIVQGIISCRDSFYAKAHAKRGTTLAAAKA